VLYGPSLAAGMFRSEAVADRGAQTVRAVLVACAVGATGGTDVIHVHRFFLQVGVGQIDGHVLIRAPAGANAEDGAVARGNAGRTVDVIGRRLVDGATGAQRPLRIELVRQTNCMSPGVVPVLILDDGGECGWSAVVLHAYFLAAAPARPGAADVQGPAIIEFVGKRKVHGFGGGQVDVGVVLAGDTNRRRGFDTSVAFQLVLHARVVGKAGTGAGCELIE